MYLCTRFFFWTPVGSIAYELYDKCRMYLCTRFFVLKNKKYYII